jgi:pyrroline-5-carboxylate reductase
MAEALAGGLVAAGVSASSVRVADVDPARCANLAERLGVTPCANNAEIVRSCEIVVLAVKPNVVAGVLAGLAADATASELARPLWISIAAGTPIARIATALPAGARIIRAMPNTPALVGAGATAVCGNDAATAADRAAALALFDSVGITWEAPAEALLDPVTGLSGSGPAYLFAFLEALVAAGAKAGLPPDAAARLAEQTVYGAAKLALLSADSPARLREKVSSPGGTTLAGLAQLEAKGFAAAVDAAVAAATARAREIGRD